MRLPMAHTMNTAKSITNTTTANVVNRLVIMPGKDSARDADETKSNPIPSYKPTYSGCVNRGHDYSSIN